MHKAYKAIKIRKLSYAFKQIRLILSNNQVKKDVKSFGLIIIYLAQS